MNAYLLPTLTVCTLDAWQTLKEIKDLSLLMYSNACLLHLSISHSRSVQTDVTNSFSVTALSCCGSRAHHLNTLDAMPIRNRVHNFMCSSHSTDLARCEETREPRENPVQNDLLIFIMHVQKVIRTGRP